MKKFALIVLFALIAISFSFAAEAEIVVSGSVGQKLTVALGSDVTGLVLDTAGDNVPLGDATIRSNIRSWVVRFKATNGALTLFDGSNYDTTQKIGYRFNFNAESSVTTEKLETATLTSTYGETNKVTFARRTSGVGDSGEDFPISIDYFAESESDNPNWVEGTYQDTIYVEVSVN